MNKQDMEYRKEQRKFEAMARSNKMVYPAGQASMDSHENNMLGQLIRYYFKFGNTATEKLLERLDEFREELKTRIDKETSNEV
jgi:transcription initiation factor IIE alpha subunit